MKGSNINTREVDFEEWSNLWIKSPNSNILQSWFYGQSKSESDGFEVMNLCVSEFGEDLALVMILKKKISFLGTIIRINRGPIFLSEGIDMDRKCEVIESVISQLKKDSLLIQMAPEIEESIELETKLKTLGFKRLPNTPWSSGKIDLSLSEEDLLMSLNGKWRNCYRKGLKMGVQISNVSDNESELKNLLEHYKNLQTKKDFSGLTDNLIGSLAKKEDPLWKFNIFKAQDNNGTLLGYVVTVDHGNTSIYLIGITTNEGRQLQANYVMLWEGIVNAKKSGSLQFDIGGLTSDTPKGVAHFKKGLKSNSYSLIGEWRRFYFRNILRF